MPASPERAASGGPDRLTLLAFAVIVLVLGQNFVAVRFSNRELPPFSGAGLRFAAASLILFGLMLLLRQPFPRGATLAGAVLYGALAFGASYAFLYAGMVHVPAATASVVVATMPLVTILLAIVLKMEQFRWRGLGGAALAVVGMAIAFQDQVRADVPIGSLTAVFLGTACAGTAGIVVKHFPKSHPISANAVGMFVGAALLMVASLVAGEAPRVPELTSTWLALAWLIGSSIVGFALFVWILARWTASAASYAAVLMPLVAVLAGAWLAGEAVSLQFLVGSALVLVGVYFGALASHKAGGPSAIAVAQPPQPHTARG